MKLSSFRLPLMAVLVCALHPDRAGAADIVLQLKPAGDQAELRWHSRLDLPVSTMYPEYRIQRSLDLRNWSNLGDPVPGGVGVSEEDLRAPLARDAGQAFYRIRADIRFAAESSGGAGVFGYGTAFARELSRIGQLSPAQFAARYGLTNEYLPAISFDPTTAAYWDAFNVDPAVWNSTNLTHPRSNDFRLNPDELTRFRQNGFVVSERLGTYSFADAFYRLFCSDLPVYVSADCILHAWHRSYVTMLEELEATHLAPELSRILDGMAAGIPAAWQQFGTGPLRDSILDADYYLAVARSLAAAATVSSVLNQDARVAATLSAIASLQPQLFDLFGSPRLVDFSQFQVRGHYEGSSLSNYFRAQMWAGRIDFRVADDPNSHTERELGTAVVLHSLLTQAGLLGAWRQCDRILQGFVGLTDSMTFDQLGDLLAAAGIHTLADLPDAAALRRLQDQLLAGQIGVQDIRSDYFFAPLGPGQLKLPRSFTVSGQKFVVDSWALSKLVYDSIVWDENGIPEFTDKVQRRVPSSLDVAFAVLGNDQVVPELVARIMLDGSSGLTFRQFRDGLPYQHNLAAARQVIESQSPEFWTNNVYTAWLAGLRALAGPTTGPEYPQAMRTRAWAMKTLNTQLASWTELRHDTVLYAKQSYTGPIICSFPDGWVEPQIEFWQRLRTLALRTRNFIITLPATGTNMVNGPYGPVPVNLATVRSNRLAFFAQFADTMAVLESIAGKQLRQEPLATNEVTFLQDLIERHDDYAGTKQYTGWYPALFYRSIFQMQPYAALQGSDAWDALVTDVHTDPPDDWVGDPGAILHQGVGAVHFLMIATERGAGPVVYAGPVLSHYEFDLDPTTRKTDSQWKAEIRAGNHPPQPDWTRSYLVPGQLILNIRY